MMNSVGADLMNATLSCDIPNYHAAGSGPHGELNLSGNVLQAGFNLRAVQLLWRGMNMKDQSMLRRTCLVMLMVVAFVCFVLFWLFWLFWFGLVWFVGMYVCLVVLGWFGLVWFGLLVCMFVCLFVLGWVGLSWVGLVGLFVCVSKCRVSRQNNTHTHRHQFMVY